MTLHAETALECESREVAAVLFERLAPWASQFSTSGFTAEGPVSHYLGGLATVLGRRDGAETYFAASAEMSARIGANSLLLGRSQMGTDANGLGSRGDTGRARRLRLCTRCSQGQWIRRCGASGRRGTPAHGRGGLDVRTVPMGAKESRLPKPPCDPHKSWIPWREFL